MKRLLLGLVATIFATTVVAAAPAGAADYIDYPINHSCIQLGSGSSYHDVLCTDLFERLGTVNGTIGAFFGLKVTYACFNGDGGHRECYGARGTQYLYVSGYGWSNGYNYGCGVYSQLRGCDGIQSTGVNPTFFQEHPTPSCRTLWSRVTDIKFNNANRLQALGDHYGTKVNFCV